MIKIGELVFKIGKGQFFPNCGRQPKDSKKRHFIGGAEEQGQPGFDPFDLNALPLLGQHQDFLGMGFQGFDVLQIVLGIQQ